ncbi:type II toxin-antitoxin system RelE/ParE family toxin [Desulfotomaculum copahuensis]|uniref:Addiction module toxin RelE n=1 Tax=Desulfotomaculum copahuensis TaxID=1838280 RepID=A0A1B7LB18_9FIRM|nr:type II toxin-antitoxin system RelE/ParE family toxin [Desulfotomaculum copahuensis]OAT79500.1 addiction module toxin RelE [Desulfotomaculum copahuensis]
MSAWKVVYTEQAENDLREIYEYIAFSLLEPVIAKKQTKRIIEAAAKLNEMPFRCRLYEKEPWRSKGLRVLPVDNYLVFYLPVEDRVSIAIIRIMYGGRNVEKQLSKY